MTEAPIDSNTITFVGKPLDNGTPVHYNFTFPAGWNEVNAAQMGAILEAQVTGTDPTQIRFRLLQDLAAIPNAIMELAPPAEHFTFEVDTTDYNTPFRPKPTSELRLLPQLDWVFSPAKYTNTLLPTIEHKGVTYAGPADGFETMVLNQWIWCSQLLLQFRHQDDANESVNDLANLLGALYQPTGKAWSSDDIEQYAAELKALPPATQLAAVLNFEAINSTLPDRYKYLYREPDEEVEPSPEGLFGMVYEVAKAGTFGPYHKVEKQLLHTVLAYMNHQLHQDLMAEIRAERASESTDE